MTFIIISINTEKIKLGYIFKTIIPISQYRPSISSSSNENGNINDNKGRLTIGYIPKTPHFFNSPTHTWNGTAITSTTSNNNTINHLNKSLDEHFSFRAVNCQNNNEISNSVTQNIIIINVNDPTVIKFSPTLPLTIYAVSNIKSNEYPTELIIDGFDVIDVDLDVDIIRADVVSSAGMY